MLLGGIFPGKILPSDEADALLVGIGALPWWSANPIDFPCLLMTSRESDCCQILSNLDLHALWSNFSFTDRFATICVALASAAPLINANKAISDLPESKASMKVLTAVLTRIKELIESPPVLEKISFTMSNRIINEDNESYEYSSHSDFGPDSDSPNFESSRNRSLQKRRPSTSTFDSPSRR
jgi:hypothetical protein